MATTTSTQAILAGLAEELERQLDPFSADIAKEIHESIHELDEDFLADTTRSCRGNIGLICRMLREGDGPTDAPAPPEAVQYARDFCRRGLPIELLLRAYRIGHQVFWRAFVDFAQRSASRHDDLAAVVAFASDWTFAYIDDVSDQIAQAYVQEREHWIRSAEAVRAEQVRTILAGGPVDEDSASRRLRYDLRRRHLAFIIWTDEDVNAENVIGAFERVAQDVARRIGGTDLLTVPLGAHLLACWSGLHEHADDAVLAGARLGDQDAHGARVAVGEAHSGTAGFRRSHEEAALARRVATLAHRSRGSVVRFPDVALMTLVSSDLTAAGRFVERELGPLAEDDDATRRLAATLKAFFEENASPVRTARRLGVHENTVAYRVRRAAELLGHPPDERQLEVRVALQLHELLRKANLPPGGPTAATP